MVSAFQLDQITLLPTVVISETMPESRKNIFNYVKICSSYLLLDVSTFNVFNVYFFHEYTVAILN